MMAAAEQSGDYRSAIIHRRKEQDQNVSILTLFVSKSEICFHTYT